MRTKARGEESGGSLLSPLELSRCTYEAHNLASVGTRRAQIPTLQGRLAHNPPSRHLRGVEAVARQGEGGNQDESGSAQCERPEAS